MQNSDIQKLWLVAKDSRRETLLSLEQVENIINNRRIEEEKENKKFPYMGLLGLALLFSVFTAGYYAYFKMNQHGAHSPRSASAHSNLPVTTQHNNSPSNAIAGNTEIKTNRNILAMPNEEPLYNDDLAQIDAAPFAEKTIIKDEYKNTSYPASKVEANYFEAGEKSSAGWHLHGPNSNLFTAFKDTSEHYTGKRSACVVAKEENFKSAWFTQEVDATPYAGKRIRISAEIKCRNKGKLAWAGLYASAQSPQKNTSLFDNLYEKGKVLNKWTGTEIVMDVPVNSKYLSVGLYKVYGGKAWIDNLKIEQVDSKTPIKGSMNSEVSDTGVNYIDWLYKNKKITYSNKVQNLGFEEDFSKTPGGWDIAQESMNFRFERDNTKPHSGKYCAILQGKQLKQRQWNTAMQLIKPNELLGKRIKFSAWIRTQDIDGYASLWLRVDKDNGTTDLDNLSDKVIRGNTGWKKYEIYMNIPYNTEGIGFGLILQQNGKAWIDDVSFEVIGELPRNYNASTFGKPINLDFEE